MVQQRQHDRAANQQRRDDSQDVAGALQGGAQHRTCPRPCIGRDLLDQARADVGIAPHEQLAEQRDDHKVEHEDAEHAKAAEILAAQRQDDRRARRAGHEGDQQRGDDAVAPGNDIARRGDRRHVAAQPQQEGHGDLAMQADMVEETVHDKGDALHDAGFLEQHQHQHQRQHVGHDDADQPHQAVGHGLADDAGRAGRLPLRHPLGKPCGGCGIDTGANFEDDIENGGEQRQRADQAPARMQEQRIQPVLPGQDAGPMPEAGHALEQAGGAMLEVRRHLLGQRPGQRGIGLPPDRAHPFGSLGEMAFQLAAEIVIALLELTDHECGRHAEGLADAGRFHRLHQLLAPGTQMLARRLRQRAGTLAHGLHRALEQRQDADALDRRHRHNGNAELGLEGRHVNVHALAPRLVHHVQAHDDRQTQLDQLQRQLQVPVQRAGIDDMNQDIGTRERRRRLAGLMGRDLGTRIAPEQILQPLEVTARKVLQRMHRRQIDKLHLVHADLNDASLIGLVRAAELPLIDAGAGHGLEDRALAAVRLADERHAQPPAATEIRPAQRNAARGSIG